MRFRLQLFLVATLLCGVLLARAERFLTVEKTQKLCFPAADRFEARTIKFTAEQVKAIQTASRQRILNKGNRIWLAWQGTNLQGVIILDHVLGKHEVIDYAVAVNPQGAVQRVEVLEYRESHGSDIRNLKWREQFIGKTDQSKLRLNDDVYNISGATISCRSVTDGVRRVLATFSVVIQPGLAVPAGTDARRMSDQPAPATR